MVTTITAIIISGGQEQTIMATVGRLATDRTQPGSRDGLAEEVEVRFDSYTISASAWTASSLRQPTTTPSTRWKPMARAMG
jgi:hypothetical protein